MQQESIAIVGMGCRFPGSANSPDAFWQLLMDEADVISEVPSSRFDIDAYYDPTPGTPGKCITRFGGFVDDIEGFDAAFFGISPREAADMDPQQRILLEVAWEALEDAGLSLDGVARDRAGVFIGMMYSDYLHHQYRNLDEFDLVMATGSARNTAAARISYAFGLEGPSLVVDSDRSSSLTAIHLACQSLRSGECSVALVGATNVILGPETTIAFSRAGMLAPDGRCKFCDARANGFVRSEGIGVVVLKTLRQAQIDGDQIYAIVRGSAVTNNGNMSGDVMRPSRTAQQAMLRAAFRNAGIAPHEIQYVEAHGTGTTVGDQVEVEALGAVLSGGRPGDRPCSIGSVKTNIGHTEAAAGIAGFMKVALSLKHGIIPRSLHYETTNPNIPLDNLPLRVQATGEPWPSSEGARIAGVSSFGLTGTLAHVVLQEAEQATRQNLVEDQDKRPQLLPLSARDPEALDELAEAYRKWFTGGNPSVPLPQICYSASVRREHHKHRLAVVADSHNEVAQQLNAYLDGASTERIASGSAADRSSGKIAFVFPGQGSQWVGMGRNLIKEEPVFADTLRRCEEAIRKEASWSLLELLAVDELDPRLQEIDFIQPTLIAMMVGLSALWRSWGIEPATVMGASMGEIAAAQVAGILSIEDAMAVVCRRTRLMKQLKGQGAMALVQLSLEEARQELEDYREELSVAVNSGPTATVISGSPGALDNVLQKLDGRGIFCKRVNVDVASHSPQMDSLREDLQNALADLKPRSGDIPFYSSVDCSIIQGTRLDAAYWARNLREPVMLSNSVEKLLQDGHDTFLEISPHPIVWNQLVESIQHFGIEAAAVPSLRRDENERQALLVALGKLYANGISPDWNALYAPAQRRYTRLPGYCWQHSDYWHDSTEFGPETAPRRRAKTSQKQQKPARSRSRLADKLIDTTIEQRKQVLTEYLLDTIKKSLKISSTQSDLDVNQPLRDLGLTSLMATELGGELERALDRHTPATLFFNYPTIAQLVEYLAAEEPVDNGERFVEPEPPASSATVRDRSEEIQVNSEALVEPIALVGIGCRFPGGADSPEEFWQLLRGGIDTISDVPSDRWPVDDYYDPDPEAPGKMYSRWGGFLESIDHFDASFFGISPREAEVLDPQQRLLLEVSLAALENAGQSLELLSGTSTGVFVGIMNNNDYVSYKGIYSDPSRLNAHDSTGHATAAAAGRLSYVFGFQGPSMAVDTACSSSLVALHLACQSLRAKECRVAIAGGVNVMIAPEVTISFCKTRMLSPTGRCKTFDASADGYVRGEGCGMVVLKRLDDAIADRDNVLAVIRGSAVNQDGRSSSLTAPNGLAQQAVVRQALQTAGVQPSEINYVEAHGTGTALGDPVEVEALGEVLGEGRDLEHPFYIGSVKTNIGHLEAAAGVAGLIKIVLSMQKQEIPPHLHLQSVNPRISLDESHAAIPTQSTPWPRGTSRRFAGVSSFGFTGTNAHVIIEEPPEIPNKVGVAPAFDILTLSAKHSDGLRELTDRYIRLLARQQLDFVDLCYTANTTRTHSTHRIAVTGSSCDEIRNKLTAFSRGDSLVEVASSGESPSDLPRIAFLFTGQGAQYPLMGKEMLDAHPAFERAFDHCAEIMDSQLERPLRSLLEDDDPATLERTEFAQPVLFALEYALFELWKSWGIIPSFVMGHSLGEYTAAYASGVLSLEDAAKVVVARGKLMQSIQTPGAAAAVFASEAFVEPFVEPYLDVMSISAENAPERVLLGGTEESVSEVCNELESQGIEVRRMTGLIAAHCPLMDPILDTFETIGSMLTYHPPQIPMVSTRTGRLIGHEEISNPKHWRDHIRTKVRFLEGIHTLYENNCEIFVEIGPRHTLVRLGEMCVPESGRVWLPSLSKEKHDQLQILDSLSEIYVRGADVDWEEFYRPYGGRHIPLPTSPFQRERFWPQSSPGVKARNSGIQNYETSLTHTSDILVGKRLVSPLDQIQYETEFSCSSAPFLRDHLVFDALIVPAAAQIARVLLTVGKETGFDDLELSEVLFPEPMVLIDDQEERLSQLVLSPTGDKAYDIEISSIAASDINNDKPAWRLHAKGRVRATSNSQQGDNLSSEELRRIEITSEEWLGGEDFYALQAQWGYTLGPSFRWLERVRLDPEEALTLLRRPGLLDEESSDGLHPGLIDSCLQMITRIPTADLMPDGDGLFVPAALEGLTIHNALLENSGSETFFGRSRLLSQSADGPRDRVASLELFTETGNKVFELSKVHLKWVEREDLLRSIPQSFDRDFYEIEWHQAPVISATSSQPGRWLIFADESGTAASLIENLNSSGHSTYVLRRGVEYSRDGNSCVVSPDEIGNLRQLVTDIVDQSDIPLTGVVFLWGLDFTDAENEEQHLSEFQDLVCRGLLFSIQALLNCIGGETIPRLWVVTRGAQCTGHESRMGSTAQASLWGLGRVAASEQDDLWGGLIDLDPHGSEDELTVLMREILDVRGQTEIAYRLGERWIPKLETLPRQRVVTGPSEFKGDVTYVVTGAFGALGRAVTSWMVDQGARHLVLMGRSELDEGNLEWLSGLEKRVSNLLRMRVDVSNLAELTEAFEKIDSTLPTLKGVIHTAGIVNDSVLSNASWPDFSDVLGPKTQGSMNLHLLTQERRLDFFVMFSSVAALLGNPGQASYAAGNAFIDALAHKRRLMGLPAISINWGPWAGSGMSATVSEDLFKRWGLISILPSDGILMLRQLMGQRHAQVCAAPIDRSVLKERVAGSRHLALVSDLLDGEVAPTVAGDSPSETDLLTRILQLQNDEQHAALLGHVGNVVKGMAGIDQSTELKGNERFDELGVDSLVSIDVIQALQRSLGISLPTTLLIDCPTLDFLCEYLVNELQKDHPDS